MTGATIRCSRCGLTQFQQATCKRCGSVLVASATSPARPRPSESNPYLDIWVNPRRAIRALIATDPTRGVLLIPWCAGLGMFLTGLAPKANDKLPLAMMVVLAFLVGPLVSFALVFTSSLLTTYTGRLLGGAGQTVEVRAAMAWAQAPLVLGVILWVPLVTATGPWRTATQSLDVGMVIWSEAIALALVAEVHGFSFWRAVGAVLIAWIVRLALFVGLIVAVVPDVKKTPPSAPPAAAAPAAPSSGP